MRAEDALQIAAVKFLHHALPEGAVYTGIEHAGQISTIQGAIRKAKGVRRGLSDLMIWWSGRFIAIELKTAKGVMSDSQKEFADGITGAGFRYYLCRSLADIESALIDAEMPLRATSFGRDERLARQLAAPKKRAGPRKAAVDATPARKRFQRVQYGL